MTTPPDSKQRLSDIFQWPMVTIIAIGCGTVFSLVYFGGQKLGDISQFLTAVAAIFIGVYIRQVKQDTNGNLSKRDAQVADLQRRLDELHSIRASEAAQMAKQVPSTASLPPTLVADPHALGADAPTIQMPAEQRT